MLHAIVLVERRCFIIAILPASGAYSIESSLSELKSASEMGQMLTAGARLTRASVPEC
jgi:hypothetical protein